MRKMIGKMDDKPTIKERDMTIFEKMRDKFCQIWAKQIADNGMNRKDVYKFFSKTNRDVVEHIGLFQTFGIHQDKTWDLYEDWQCEYEV